MATVLVTGATGTVGHPVAARLIARGDTVRALVRDPARARPLIPEGVEPVAGDVTDAASLAAATAGCELVFHAAGLPEQWRLDNDDFDRVNRLGTLNVVNAASAAGVRRLVYTSTIDVFAWTPGQAFDESRLATDPLPTHYERSKQEADRIVTAAVEQGLDAVFLHPSAVYGASPVLTGLNEFLCRLANRKIPALLPGGMPVVLADDVADGHIAAADGAPSGARFILSGGYETLAELAAAVRREVPRARVPPVMPLPIARAVSAVGERVARVTKRAPLIPRGPLDFLLTHRVPSSAAAERELGWRATPFPEGLRLALEHHRAAGWVR